MNRFVAALVAVWVCGALCAPCLRGADDTRHGVAAPGFHTLQVRVDDNLMSPAVITLDGDDKLHVSFDELADEHRYLRYSLVHCDAMWRADGLLDSEFLDGFNEVPITEYEYSKATLTHYVHYSLTLPNDEIRLKASGNYLLRVYDESDVDSVLVQVRFSVSEAAVAVQGSVSPKTDIDHMDAHQQLSIEVDTRNRDMADRFESVTLVVGQNGRYDNETVIAKPLSRSATVLRYEHLPRLIFEAGNEYRRFETVSLTYPGMGLDDIDHDHTQYHATVATDYPREEYRYDETQRGRYVVRGADLRNDDTEAEYVMTHFSLEMPRQYGIDIYLDGDMTCRRLDNTSKMHYDGATGRYEKSLLLKQGSYNYAYLARRGSGSASPSVVEGNFYPTQNEYLVKVFYREPGGRYDRLVGAAMIYPQWTD